MAIVQLTAIAPGQAVAEAQAAAGQPVVAAGQPVAVVASSRSPAMAAQAAAKGAPPADAETQAQTVATQPMTRYMIFGVAATAGGIIGGLILQHLFHPGLTKLPVLPTGVGIFALFYVMAQAIERLLVPVSWFGGGFLGGSGSGTKSNLAKKRQSTIVSAMQAPDDGGKAQAAADAKHELEQYKANLTATTFGMAALLAMLVSGYTGLFLLATAHVHIPGWLDLVVTGLAIAGGTKPLHDAISNISSASDKKTATAG